MYLYLILILLIPYQTHSVFSENIFGLSVIKIVGICTLISGILYNPSVNERIRLFDSPIAKSFLLYCLTAIIDWFWSSDWIIGPAQQSFLSFFLFFYVTMRLVDNERKIRQVFWSLAISISIASVYILREYFAYRGAMGPNFRTFGATFGDPNYYALSAILVLPFLFYLYKTSAETILRVLLSAMMLTLFGGLLVTQSRGALIGLAMMALISVVLSKARVKALIILFLAGSIAIIAMPDSFKNRIASTKISEEKSVSGDEASTTRRWYLFLAGVEMIKDKPLTGIGLGRFKEKSLEYYPNLLTPGIAHSTYIEIMAEMGIPAIVFFFSVIFFSLKELLLLRKSTCISITNIQMVDTMFMALSGFIFSCTFLSGQYTKVYWIIVFLIVKIKQIIIKKE